MTETTLVFEIDGVEQWRKVLTPPEVEVLDSWTPLPLQPYALAFDHEGCPETCRHT